MIISFLRALGTAVVCLAILGVLPAEGADTAPKTRLFILSGQSNMKNLNPDDTFTPALKAAYPNDDIIVVKDAQSGNPIRRWYKDWKSASGDPMDAGKNGRLYTRLMAAVNEALKDKPKPDTVTFLWMQGEADTHSADTANVYADSLKWLISRIRTDLKRPDTYVVIGRISDFNYEEFPEGVKTVREAEVAVAEADPLAGWIDTDDLNGEQNGLHYTKDGYAKLGQRFAEKAIALEKLKTR